MWSLMTISCTMKTMIIVEICISSSYNVRVLSVHIDTTYYFLLEQKSHVSPKLIKGHVRESDKKEVIWERVKTS